MDLKPMDVVRLRGAKALGEVQSLPADGKIIVRWATTASGQPLKHWTFLMEKVDDLEKVDRLTLTSLG